MFGSSDDEDNKKELGIKLPIHYYQMILLPR